MPSTDPAHSRPLFDPGWLFLLSGLALLGAVVIIPAVEDVAAARFKRDQVLAIEQHRDTRMARYEEFINAVDSREPALLVSLAQTQLNQIPADRSTLPLAGNQGQTGASVFPSLEPEPLKLPERTKVVSRLEHLTTDPTTRPFVIIGGAFLILVGLLPTGRSRPA
ncbi:MAG: hypothetical protein WCK33_09340 [Phycisphaerae bacterium]